jgi:hypothetical protein
LTGNPFIHSQEDAHEAHRIDHGASGRGPSWSCPRSQPREGFRQAFRRSGRRPRTCRTGSRARPALLGVESAGPETLTIHTVDQFRAGKQIGYAYKQFKQHRITGGTVSCGAKNRAGAYTMDVRGRVGSGWFGFLTLPGAIRLTITHEVEVAGTQFGPPSCRQDSGTWTGNIPPLVRKRGTWKESNRRVFVFSKSQERVLEPPAAGLLGQPAAGMTDDQPPPQRPGDETAHCYCERHSPRRVPVARSASASKRGALSPSRRRRRRRQPERHHPPGREGAARPARPVTVAPPLERRSAASYRFRPADIDSSCLAGRLVSGNAVVEQRGDRAQLRDRDAPGAPKLLVADRVAGSRLKR